MTTSHPAVAAARDALQQGFRYLAARVNAILTDKKHKLAVSGGGLLQEDDSIRRAADLFRRVLYHLRTLTILLPPEDSKITPWTLGRINGPNNRPCLIDLAPDCLESLEVMFTCLAGRSWDEGAWRLCIIDEMEQHHAGWMRLLDTIEPAIVPPSAAPATGREAGGRADYLDSWAQILDALDRPNNVQNRQLVRRLVTKFGGPIKLPIQGGQPSTERGKLVQWWEGLAAELVNRPDASATVAEQHAYGRTGTVVPVIGGSVKKRRGGST